MLSAAFLFLSTSIDMLLLLSQKYSHQLFSTVFLNWRVTDTHDGASESIFYNYMSRWIVFYFIVYHILRKTGIDLKSKNTVDKEKHQPTNCFVQWLWYYCFIGILIFSELKKIGFFNNCWKIECDSTI